MDTVEIPKGYIALWGDTNPESIPLGWVLCDGTNGTPTIDEKFRKKYISKYNDEPGLENTFICIMKA